MQFLPELEFNVWTIIFVVFGTMALIQFFYVVFVFARLAFFKEREIATTLPPVSIIIAARNEADNIYEHLPFILTQDYPDYEVIVVVNQSVDESKHILQAYQQQYPHLRYTIVEKSRHLRPGKKLSVTLGIKSAKNEHLVFTDADCKPNSKTWLREITGQFNERKEIVLGYGPYIKEKGFLNRIIRFDTAWIAVNYMSFALAKIPYMGVGRNMAYTKKVFDSASGFKSHYSIASGDDDLFIQEVAKKKNYTIVISKDSFMYSEGEKTWTTWVLQKTRHYTTSPKYQVIKKALLGIYPLTLLILLGTFITLLCNEEFRLLTLTVFGALILLKWWIQGKCFLQLKEKSFVAFFPISDFLYALLSPIVYYSGESKNRNRW